MKIIRINPHKIEKEKLNKVARLLKRGGVIISPTDTVYGLLADATNQKAIRKIFKIKKRDKKNAIPIFVKNLKTAKKIAVITGKEEKNIKKYWPGKVTFILKQRNVLPKILSGKEKTIGLRIPDYKIIRYLLAETKRSLTGTSANISGLPSATKIGYVLNQFQSQKNKPDLILDAENLKPSKPSTIVDLTAEKPKIIRKGAIKFKI